MNLINAKFKSKCVETGATIAKGENCLYDKVTKKIYCRSSKKFLAEQETENTSSFIEAQENAYFDNF
jgi:methionyl-tRNA synthetase